MDEKEDILTRILRNRLSHYEHPVEDDRIWAAIEHDLSKSEAVSKRPPWKKIISTAAAIVLLFCLNLFIRNDHTTEPVAPIATINNQITDSQGSLPEEMPEASFMSRKQPAPLLMADNNSSSRKENKQKTEEGLKEKTKTTPVGMPEDKNDSETPHSTKTDPEKTDPSPKYNKPKSGIIKEAVAPASFLKKKNNKFSVALAMGNAGINSPENRNTNYFRYNVSADSNLDKLYMVNQTDATVTNTKYNIPVSVGFSVRKYFSDYWALESGLIYTYLSSTETSTDNSTGNSWKRKVELHYLGLPIKAVYSFCNINNLSLYATIGGMGEICVYGKKTDDSNGSVKELNVPEIQWSVSAGLGLNYKLARRVYLFVEPGIIYYFNDGSDIKTIRKKTPLNFNMQLGIRLTY